MDTKHPARREITLMTDNPRTPSGSPWLKKQVQPVTKGGVAIIVTLLALLVGAVAFAVYGWRAANMEIPAYAWGALAAGSFFSVLVGGGLMALVFYSSRSGYDEPARLTDSRPSSTEN